MHKKALVRAGSVAAAVTLAAAAFPGAAPAAGSSAHCTVNICQAVGYGFPGGTVSIDADVSGSGNGSWTINGKNGWKCSATFPAAGGARSWTCSGAPKGDLTATVGGNSGPAAVGVRW